MRLDGLLPQSFIRQGLHLRYYDSGGPGLPVVFQHGLCGDARQTFEAFPDDARFRLITLECRGHGGSEPGDPARFSIKTFASDVASLIATLGIGPAVVGGISMGSAIGLHLARHAPDQVRGLIAARPAWVASAAPANMRPNAEAGELLQELGPDRGRAVFAEGATARRLAQEAPDNLTSLLGFFDRQPLKITAALLTAISADGPGVTDDDLRALSLPSLVVGHEKDAVHPLAHARALADLIPGAHLAEITPKAVDKAAYLDDFHHALTAFLQGLFP